MADIGRQFVRDFLEIKNSPLWDEMSFEEQQDITEKAKGLLGALNEKSFAPEFNEARAYAETEQQFEDINQARAAQKSLPEYFANSLYRGINTVRFAPWKLAGFGLDAIGADDLSSQLMQEIEGREIAVQDEYPRVNKSLSEMSLSDAPKFASDIFGENIPMMLATAGGGAALAGARIPAMLGGTLSAPAAQALSTYVTMSLPEVYDSVKKNGGGALAAALFAAPHAAIENLGGLTPAKISSWFTREGVKDAVTKGTLKEYLTSSLKTSLGEGLEEVGQGVVERAAKHFGGKDFDKAAAALSAELQDSRTWDEMATEFVGGGIFGLAGGSYDAYSQARSAVKDGDTATAEQTINDKINDGETDIEEKKRLALAKDELKADAPDLQAQKDAEILSRPLVDLETEEIQASLSETLTEGQIARIMKAAKDSKKNVVDYLIEKAEKMQAGTKTKQVMTQAADRVAKLRERYQAAATRAQTQSAQPVAPLALPGTISSVSTESLGADLNQPNIIHSSAGWSETAPEDFEGSIGTMEDYRAYLQEKDNQAKTAQSQPAAVEYPRGKVGKQLQALDEAEVADTPGQSVVYDPAAETPMLPYQPDQTEGRQLADNGGVIMPARTQDFIVTKGGAPFANQANAKAFQTKNQLTDYDITPVRGGFALMRKPTQQQNVRRVAVETPRGGNYQPPAAVRVEGVNIPTENRTVIRGNPDAAARLEKKLQPTAEATTEQAKPGKQIVSNVKDLPAFQLPEWLATDETAQSLVSSTGKIIDVNMNIGRGTIEKVLPPSKKHPFGAVIVKGFSEYAGNKKVPPKRDTFDFVMLRDRIRSGKSRLLSRDGLPEKANPKPGKPIYSVEYIAARYAAKGLRNAAEIVNRGFNLIQSGTTRLIDWARQMLNEFGQASRSYLSAIWNELNAFNKRLGRTGAIGGRPATPGSIKEDLKKAGVMSDEVTRRAEAAFGLKDKEKTIIERLRSVFNGFRRRYPSLDPAVHGENINLLLQLERSSVYAQTKALRTIAGITKGLSPDQYHVFTWNLIFADMLSEADKGNAQNLERFGFESEEQLREYAHIYQEHAEKDKTVSEALAKREELRRNIVSEMVDAGLLPESAIENSAYYHRQVMNYFNEKEKNSPQVSGRGLKNVKRGFQKGRIDNSLDFNTNYIEAEYEWLAQAFKDLKVSEVRQRFKNGNDIKKELETRAKRENDQRAQMLIQEKNLSEEYDAFGKQIGRGFNGLSALASSGQLEEPAEFKGVVQSILDKTSDPRIFRYLSYIIDNNLPGYGMASTIFQNIRAREEWVKNLLDKEYKTWESYLDENSGYVKYQPEPGNIMFPSKAIDDGVLQKILAGVKGLNEGAFRDAMVLGVPRETWVVPAEVAEALKDTERYSMRDPESLETLSQKVMNTWKQNVLMNPLRAIKYNLNNSSGDLDIVFAVEPGVLSEAEQAFADLWNKTNLDLAIEMGVIGSDFVGSEIQDISKDALFGYITGNENSLLKKYWSKIKDATTFRENFLRLAAFRYYLKNPDKLGVSVAEEVTAIKDPAERAAKLARDLLGDYGNISKNGEWLRKNLIPFWAWTEINTPRYFRAMRNAFYESDASGATRLAAIAGKKAAWNFAKFVLGANILQGLITAWNRMRFPEEDKDLRKSRGGQLHLILGKDSTGQVKSIRFQGALSDALGWFGLDSPITDAAEIATGKQTLQEKLGEKGWEVASKLFNSITPFPKFGMELITGKSTYPRIDRPTQIRDRKEHFARFLVLDPVYKALAGKPSRGKLDTMLSLFGVYSTDPDELAFNQVRGIASKFLEESGSEKPAGEPTQRSNALYYYKQAKKYGDKAAEKRYLEEYRKLGGTMQNMKKSVEAMDPLRMVSQKDRAKFLRSLTPEERKLFDRARAWYKKTYL